jgi:DNA-binding Lrp family transcriptional regulator
MDALDLRLLAELQSDASRSNQDLAEALHISPATCLRRVRRLQSEGLIERSVALLSPDRLGHGLTALVEIVLDTQAVEKLDAFEARVCADAAVQQCYRTSGGPDFVLVLHVLDMPAYQQAVQRLFTSDANVRNVRAYFALKRAKFAPALMLPPAAAAS